MLILGTLIVTWIAHNWWKILLLIVAIIVIHEYVVHKKHGEYPKANPEAKDAESAAEPVIEESNAEPVPEKYTAEPVTEESDDQESE